MPFAGSAAWGLSSGAGFRGSYQYDRPTQLIVRTLSPLDPLLTEPTIPKFRLPLHQTYRQRPAGVKVVHIAAQKDRLARDQRLQGRQMGLEMFQIGRAPGPEANLVHFVEMPLRSRRNLPGVDHGHKRKFLAADDRSANLPELLGRERSP